MIANVKPVPDYVKRITTADIAFGETNGAFHIWPTARPAITVEPGERYAIALRIRAQTPAAGSLKLPNDAPESWKLRREENGDYWLDISIEPSSTSSSRTVLLDVVTGGNRSRGIRVQLSVNVPAENLVVSPREVDFGNVDLSSVKGLVKRVGVRKIVGTFRIKSLTSSLAFLKLEQATMVDGSNYLIRITVDPTKPLTAGPHDGKLTVETDEGHRIEVPIRINLINP